MAEQPPPEKKRRLSADLVPGYGGYRFGSPTEEVVIDSGTGAGQNSSKKKGNNTEKTNAWGVKVFRDWARERNERMTDPNDSVPEDLLDRHFSNDTNSDVTPLNQWVSRFIVEVRNRDGKPYPPNTIKSLLAAMMRHMRSKNPTTPDFMARRDPRFRDIQTSLEATIRTLEEQGIGVVAPRSLGPNYLSFEVEKTLWARRIFGLETPVQLQRAVIYYVAKFLGIKSGPDHRALKPSQFRRYREPDRYHVNVNSNMITINADPSAGERCFVNILDRYFSRLPDYAGEKDVFYLRPKAPTVNGVWYDSLAIGKEKLRTAIRDMCTEAGVKAHNSSGKDDSGFTANTAKQIIKDCLDSVASITSLQRKGLAPVSGMQQPQHTLVPILPLPVSATITSQPIVFPIQRSVSIPQAQMLPVTQVVCSGQPSASGNVRRPPPVQSSMAQKPTQKSQQGIVQKPPHGFPVSLKIASSSQQPIVQIHPQSSSAVSTQAFTPQSPAPVAAASSQVLTRSQTLCSSSVPSTMTSRLVGIHTSHAPSQAYAATPPQSASSAEIRPNTSTRPPEASTNSYPTQLSPQSLIRQLSLLSSMASEQASRLRANSQQHIASTVANTVQPQAVEPAVTSQSTNIPASTQVSANPSTVIPQKTQIPSNPPAPPKAAEPSLMSSSQLNADSIRQIVQESIIEVLRSANIPVPNAQAFQNSSSAVSQNAELQNKSATSQNGNTVSQGNSAVPSNVSQVNSSVSQATSAIPSNVSQVSSAVPNNVSQVNSAVPSNVSQVNSAVSQVNSAVSQATSAIPSNVSQVNSSVSQNTNSVSQNAQEAGSPVSHDDQGPGGTSSSLLHDQPQPSQTQNPSDSLNPPPLPPLSISQSSSQNPMAQALQNANGRGAQIILCPIIVLKQ